VSSKQGFRFIRTSVTADP